MSRNTELSIRYYGWIEPHFGSMPAGKSDRFKVDKQTQSKLIFDENWSFKLVAWEFT